MHNTRLVTRIKHDTPKAILGVAMSKNDNPPAGGNMKITVLGCGALGQIWLAALARQGHDVQGWLRVPQPYCSVNVIDPDGHVSNHTFIANDPLFLAESQLLLVTLKAPQVSPSVKN